MIKKTLMRLILMAMLTGYGYAKPEDFKTEALYPAQWLYPTNMTAITNDVLKAKLGHAWDFETEGNFQGFGHFSAGITNAAVKGGALQFTVSAPGGSLGWGNVDNKMPLKDQMTFPNNSSVLSFCVKQTAAKSTWKLQWMCKNRAATLLYPINPVEVNGTNEQTVRFGGCICSAPIDGFTVTIETPEKNEISIHAANLDVVKRQAYFRKKIILPEGQIFRAVVNVAKKERFFINGQEIGLPRHQFFAIKAYQMIGVDVVKYLHSGENVFAIMIDGSWQDPIVYLEGGVVMDSGDRVPIMTDPTWKMSPQAPADWAKPGFDDTAWSPVVGRAYPSYYFSWDSVQPIPNYSGRIVIENPYEDKLYYADTNAVAFNISLPAGLAANSPVLRYRVAAGSNAPLSEGQVRDLAVKDGKLAGSVKLSPMPRGVYELATELVVNEKVVDRRTEIFIVVGKLPQPEVAGDTYEEGMKLKLCDTITCYDPKDQHPFQAGGGGQSVIIDQGKLKYREAGQYRGLGQPTSYFAYKFKAKSVGKPHLVVVEYPDDKTRIMQVEICNLPALTAADWDTLSMWSISKTGSGTATGDRFPVSYTVKKLRIIYHPDMEDQVIFAVTAGQDRPAAISRILIYEIEDELPAVKITPGGERRLGLHTERGHSFNRPFIQGLPVDPKRPLTFKPWDGSWDPDNFKQQLEVIENYVRYMRFCGENMYMAGAYQYGDHNSPYPESPLVKDARLELDYRDLLCKVFEHNGITMLAGIEYNWAERLVYFENLSPCDGEMARGADTMWVVSRTGEQSAPYGRWWAPGPPSTVANIFHPVVKGSILRIADDICKRWARYPAFKGVVFSSYPGELGLVIGAVPLQTTDFLSYGYEDATIKQFEQETGVKIPVDPSDLERFQKRYNWLMQNAHDQWIAWRCQKVVDLQKDVAKMMKTYRPDLKSYNLFYNSLSCIEDWQNRSGGMDFKTYMSRMGQDFTLYKNIPDVIAGRFIYNSSGNWRNYNRHPEVIQSYERPNDRTVMVHCPFDENCITNAWTETFPWKTYLACAPEPSVAFHETFTQSLIDSDPDTILYGWMDGNLLFGQEENRRKFNQAFVSLPKERFREVQGPEIDSNLVVKELKKGDDYYFYVVNPGWWDVQCAVELNQQALVTDLGTGEARQRAKVETAIGPYGVRSFRTDKGAGGITKVKGTIDAKVVQPFMNRDIEALKGLAALPDAAILLSDEEQAYFRQKIQAMENDLKAGAYRKVYESRNEQKMNNIIAVLKAIGTIRAWKVIGPFKNEDNDGPFKQAFEVEQDVLAGKLDFTREYMGLGTMGETKIKWRHALTGNHNGFPNFVNFDNTFSPNDWVIAYAFTRIYSPEEREVKVACGSDDGMRLWFNGQMVIDDYVARGAGPKQDVVPVKLKKGWNEALVKVEERIGGWGFFLEFLDSADKPLTDLIFSPRGGAAQK